MKTYICKDGDSRMVQVSPEELTGDATRFVTLNSHLEALALHPKAEPVCSGFDCARGGDCPKCDADLIAAQSEAEPEQGHAKLRELLAELFALVKGECPSLLNEDSGGDARLYLDIEAALQSSPVEPVDKAGLTEEKLKGVIAYWLENTIDPQDKADTQKIGELALHALKVTQ